MAIRNTTQPIRSGFAGTLSHQAPTRVAPYTLDSSDETDNVFGRAFTIKDQTDETVQNGDSGAFAGILVNHNAQANLGFIENGKIGQFCTMGDVNVEILVGQGSSGGSDVAPAIGGKVYFVVATGKLSTGSFTNTTANVEIVGATIVRHQPSDAGDGAILAQIALTGPQA